MAEIIEAGYIALMFILMLILSDLINTIDSDFFRVLFCFVSQRFHLSVVVVTKKQVILL
jgi:hypothetical protein